MGKTDVVLVNMPFGPLHTPSIGLGLLQAALTRCGVSSKCLYFTFDYARIIGEATYSLVSDEMPAHQLIGEWIFSDALFDHQSDSEVRRYVDSVLRLEGIRQDLINQILSARERVREFLDECVERTVEYRARIAGFTSTFQQHLASLSMAKRLKESCPELFIVFGGANCEGVMGLETLRQFSFVDAVVSGEGDLVFPELVGSILAGAPASQRRGVFSRRSLSVLDRSSCSSIVENLDELPMPDYDDYFAELNRNRLEWSKKSALLFETSRGCWWGEKHHCTFCGLNGQTMTHRSKTAQHALNELVELTKRHPGYSVNVVDNILDMGYFKDFIPMLAKRGLGIELFYEVKANLTKDQLRLLRAAGIVTIQPGIESLSDIVLKSMRKGVTSLQNIRLLKWCRPLRINPQWNFIWGFPDEPPEEYTRLAELVPLLTHLTPPQGASQIRIDRFSPNFNNADELGFKGLSPYSAYYYVYPLAPEAINNLAYFFEFDYAQPRDVASYAAPLAEEITKWRKCHEKSYLFWIDYPDRLLIWDSRPVAKDPLTVLTGFEKFCYKACDAASTASRIKVSWETISGEPIGLDKVNEVLEAFRLNGLMVKSGNHFLSLAIDGNLDRESNCS